MKLHVLKLFCQFGNSVVTFDAAYKSEAARDEVAISMRARMDTDGPTVCIDHEGGSIVINPKDVRAIMLGTMDVDTTGGKLLQ